MLRGTKAIQDDTSSNSCSIAGSFISDTITLNGAGVGGGGGIETLSNQYRMNKNGGGLGGKSTIVPPQRTCIEDEEKTENDQDLDEELFDDEFGKPVAVSESQYQEKRELLRALNGDLTTLDQLKEQKRLLRSIQLRKEELKALEGRRKALEALKKLAGTDEPVVSGIEAARK